MTKWQTIFLQVAGAREFFTNSHQSHKNKDFLIARNPFVYTNMKTTSQHPHLNKKLAAQQPKCRNSASNRDKYAFIVIHILLRNKCAE